MKLRVQDQGKTWKEVVREDCQARKLNKEDAVEGRRAPLLSARRLASRVRQGAAARGERFRSGSRRHVIVTRAAFKRT